MGKSIDNFGPGDSFCQPQVALSVNGGCDMPGSVVRDPDFKQASAEASCYGSRITDPVHFRLYFFV